MSASENFATLDYRALRAAGKDWSAKVLHHPSAKRFDILTAARKLGFSIVERAINFEDESDLDVLHDFYLYDFRVAGSNLVESCTFAPGGLTPLEVEFHNAALTATSSLFEVVASHENEPKVLLRDRLDSRQPDRWLTDIGFSASFRRLGPVLLFARILSPRGLSMTSGASFVFERRHEPALLEGCRRALWSATTSGQRSTRLMVHLFGRNRILGASLMFRDTDPHGGSER